MNRRHRYTLRGRIRTRLYAATIRRAQAHHRAGHYTDSLTAGPTELTRDQAHELIRAVIAAQHRTRVDNLAAALINTATGPELTTDQARLLAETAIAHLDDDN